LRRQHGLTADNVTRIVARLPEDGARIVNDSAMPDVNCQYILAVGLIDGAVSFADSHSHERMKDPRVLAVKQRIELVADRALMDPDAPRSGRVEVTLRDGRQLSHFTRFAPGTKENPLDADGVNAKVRDLIVPVVGVRRSDEIIRSVHAIETFNDMKVFVRLLTQA
jgi:2-methylcitrate dehydratase PrpD